MAAAVKDTAYRNLSKTVIDFFESLGSQQLSKLRHQESWAFVGGGIKDKKGNTGYVEERREITKRRATVTKTFAEPVDHAALHRAEKKNNDGIGRRLHIWPELNWNQEVYKYSAYIREG